VTEFACKRRALSSNNTISIFRN